MNTATRETPRPVPFKVKLLCRLAYFIFWCISSTYKVKYLHRDRIDEARKMHPAGSFVYGLWHENFFAAVATHKGQPISPMISQSNDGELISYISEKLGFTPVRGSTSRGGESAREELYKRINAGLAAAFTADGPKGPRRKMKSGLIDLSRSGRMAIVPLAVYADRKWILEKSWDKSLIPKPFAKVVVVYGNPFIVDAEARGARFAEAKRSAAASLNSTCDESEQFFNHGSKHE